MILQKNIEKINKTKIRNEIANLNSNLWQTLPKKHMRHHSADVERVSNANAEPCMSTEINSECSYGSGFGRNFAHSKTFTKTFDAKIMGFVNCYEMLWYNFIFVLC